MTREHSPRQFDAREEGKGNAADGNERRTPTSPDIDDSLTEPSVPGRLAPKPRPSGFEGEAPSEMGPTESGSGEVRWGR